MQLSQEQLMQIPRDLQHTLKKNLTKIITPILSCVVAKRQYCSYIKDDAHRTLTWN